MLIISEGKFYYFHKELVSVTVFADLFETHLQQGENDLWYNL